MQQHSGSNLISAWGIRIHKCPPLPGNTEGSWYLVTFSFHILMIKNSTYLTPGNVHRSISIICDEVNMYFPPIYYVHIFCLVREYSTAVVHESQNVLAFSVLTHLVISPRSCKYTHWNKFQNQPCPFIPFLIKNNYL